MAKNKKTVFVLTYRKKECTEVVGTFTTHEKAKNKIVAFCKAMVKPEDMDMPADCTDDEYLDAYFEEGTEGYEIEEKAVK
jgi:hypothetical protein